MEVEHSFDEIFYSLSDTLNHISGKLIRETLVGTVSAVNPSWGAAAVAFDSFVSGFNEFKFSGLVTGLSTGLNRERYLNELYNYVNSGSDRAIVVANLFRKTINAECPKVCIIYRLILSKHVENQTTFSYDELIVCKALENATEFDLDNFREIMEHYLESTSTGKRIVFPEGFEDLASFSTTCEWCVYNRLFVSRINEWGEFGGESLLDLRTHYYTNTPASVLQEYIDLARQIWDYGENI